MIILLLILTSVIAVIGSWLYLRQDCRNIPGPAPYPLIGNADKFFIPATGHLDLFQNLRNSYGKAVLVHLFHQRYIVLSHPKYIEPVMTRTDLITKGRSYAFLRPWLGDGLVLATGNRWHVHRKLLTPAFHFNILKNFLPVFLKNEKILMKTLMRLSDGPAIDVFPIIALHALDNVAESIMGISVNAQENSGSKYVKAIESVSKVMMTRIRNPFMAEEVIFNLSPHKRRQNEALKVLHGQTRAIITKRRDKLNSLNITHLDAQEDTGVRNKNAFLDLLLLSEIDGQRISDEHVREEVDTFLFEGHDTTTSCISFVLYLLSKHPDEQERLLEEQKSILGEDLDRDPTYSELTQMKYLELVIKESLRLYPSVPLIERMITKDTDLADIHIKSNSTTLIDIFHLQRDPEVFEDPLEFRPERFKDQNIRNPFHHIAFSAGPRNCIGQKFAMMEVKTTVAGVVKRFKLLPSNEEPQLCVYFVLKSENGLKVQFKAR